MFSLVVIDRQLIFHKGILMSYLEPVLVENRFSAPSEMPLDLKRITISRLNVLILPVAFSRITVGAAL